MVTLVGLERRTGRRSGDGGERDPRAGRVRDVRMFGDLRRD